jgi:signal transduction histidine kinase
MRPLDRLTSIKTKLGALIVGAVVAAVACLVVANRLDVPLKLSAPRRRPARPGGRPGARARDDLAAARDGQGGAGDGQGRLPPAGHGQLARRGRRAGQAFNRMAAELAETERLRRDLIANVSHELRTPIAVLQAVLENLVDGVEPPEPATLRTMLRQVERLGRLAAQLLDLSRLESGAVPLRWRPVALE